MTLASKRRIEFEHLDDGILFRIESGCLTLDATLADGRRQVMLVLYPGDIIRRAFAPDLGGLGVTATCRTVLTRLRLAPFRGETGPGAGQTAAVPGLTPPPGLSVVPELSEVSGRLLARSALHAITLGKLTGEERLATLLLEFACYFGRPPPGLLTARPRAVTFELPLSRADMADYLALNPDTLSRLISRFRSRGLITLSTRRLTIVNDLDALIAQCPLARALRLARPAADVRTARSATSLADNAGP